MLTRCDAYRLMHEGTLALAQVEANGIRIDTDRLIRTKAGVLAKLRNIRARMKEYPEWEVWRRRFGAKSKVSSGDQLATVLFAILGYESHKTTAGGKPSSDEENLKWLKDVPIVRDYLICQKLEKMATTYLGGIQREVIDGILRPSFMLHTTVTYRSSSSDPNFQNLPIRDERMAKVIRQLFVPRDGHVLVEVDYSGIEVKIAACYHKDPRMIWEIENHYDLHKEMGSKLFKLPLDDVSKKMRHVAKNSFVFAEFYGGYYKKIAPSIWNAIERDGLKLNDGSALFDYLQKRGIDRLGKCDPKGDAAPHTYEYHVKQVEDKFWNERFPVYRDWKHEWWEAYQRTGGFDTLTGFHIEGNFKRNEAINYPIQGSAFHCLLWSLIRLNCWLRKNKMRSMIVGQIHDSMVMDVHRDELQDVLYQTKKIMCDDIRKAWDWIIVPLEIEAEVAETNWFEKKPFELGVAA